MEFNISRTQPATGGKSRTDREEMAPLFAYLAVPAHPAA